MMHNLEILFIENNIKTGLCEHVFHIVGPLEEESIGYR